MFIIGTNQAYAIFGNVFLPLSLVFFSLLFGAMITFYSSVEKKPKTSAGGPQSNPSDNPEDESWTKWFKDNWHWIALSAAGVIGFVAFVVLYFEEPEEMDPMMYKFYRKACCSGDEGKGYSSILAEVLNLGRELGLNNTPTKEFPPIVYKKYGEYLTQQETLISAINGNNPRLAKSEIELFINYEDAFGSLIELRKYLRKELILKRSWEGYL